MKEPRDELMRSSVARPWLRSALRAGALVLIIGLLAGCLLPPEPKTEAAQDVFNLYLVILALAALVFIGVEGFIVYAVVRYRRRPGDEELPPQVHGNNLVEIIWTAIPSVIVAIIFVVSMITLSAVEARSAQPGVTIDVTGFQWQWVFSYSDDGVEVTGSPERPPRMAVPVGEPVRLRLHSNDVIHSFFVPQFLIKRDLIPVGENGHANELEFTVSEAGTYSGQCAEFCGVSHAQMTFVIDAMARADYDAWIVEAQSGAPPPPPAGECGTTVEISAQNIAFSTDTIEVAGGEDFCITLTNDDIAPHDVTILDGSVELFNGEDVPAGESATYHIAGLEPGEYRFICSLHPAQMVGELTATE